MSRRASKKSARVAASVPAKLKKELASIARQYDMSESRLIQEAIARFVDDYRAGKVGLFTSKK